MLAMRCFSGFRRALFAIAAIAMVCVPAQAWAHIGPPFPILQDQRVGPLTVSVWSNPDVGTGSFFVIINPPDNLPPNMRVQVAVQPVSKRLPEQVYDAWREKVRNEAEYKTVVPFDKEETWHVRVLLTSAQVSGQVETDVAVTPPGFGRWDLLLFLLPFLGIGVLWFKAMSTKRERRKRAELKRAQADGVK